MDLREETFMKRVAPILILTILMSCSALGQAIERRASHKAEQVVRRINDEVDRAFLQSDIEALNQLIAGRCIFTGRDGSVGNKAEVLSIFKSAIIKFVSIEAEVEKLYIYGNAAVVTGKARTKGRRFEQEIYHLVRYTRVYIKQRKSWKLAAEQVTRIEE